MNYDITTPDSAYSWIYDALKINQGQFLEDYILKRKKDLNTLCEMYKIQINKLDLKKLEIIAFQVTSCIDDCTSIKKSGLKNLQWVLSNDTEMRNILQQNGVKFDVDEKKMYVLYKEYDIDYEKYRGVYNLSEEEENIERIAHKVYYDFQINAFLFCENISKYSTVCEMPEFLYTLSNFSKDVQEVGKAWKKDRKLM